MRKVLLAVVFSLLLLPSVGAAARPHLDLGFELSDCASGWSAFSNPQVPYQFSADSAVRQAGQQSLRIRYTSSNRWVPESGRYSVGQQFPVSDIAGKAVRLSGMIRTEGVTTGYAGLWWTSINQDDTSTFSSMGGRGDRGATGDTSWTRFQIEFRVAENVDRAFFGVELNGSGAAWFDDLKVEIDGKPWVEGPVPGKPSPQAVRWVRRKAIPFSTPLAGSGFSDLQPLKRVIGDARIVSLGEGTHGTREFFQMKHRLMEFLAVEMGFTHFAIEANMPEAEKVNDYVLTGVGDPYELLEGMYFWTWNTQEVLDMVLWMREFNASGKGTIQFQGFDNQYSAVAANNVLTFLQKAEPGYVSQADRIFGDVIQAERNRATTPNATGIAAAAKGVFDHLSAKRGEYVQRFPAKDVDWIIQNANIILQSANTIARISSRDAGMAENVTWILDHAPAGSKIVLWAHNAHASKTPGWMGHFLDQRYGDQQIVLGFAFGTGRYNAFGSQGLRDYDAGAPVQGSVESLLAATGRPRFILDLRNVDSTVAGWFNEPRGFRSLGSVVVRCPFQQTVTSNLYDGLIWFSQTSASELLPFDR